MDPVDILFPWRKRPPQSQQQQAQSSFVNERNTTSGHNQSGVMYGYTSESARMFDTTSISTGTMSKFGTGSGGGGGDEEGTFVG
eukprot:CAMPEP_0201706320 /NCGR_PEP_ID=MMETSP0578-20130828/48425_1 /ASSEMBLY_ACC=CAM_ASM_000663 /TAXON_ID=267565 /ORGANISM="Skeletonema grethea, Strain CCMP 1804" /LENGTH=83 /DNA_ID=CAMNT_0048194755 /DNA_START=41 /DNA_END=288 /DNA_ORIENTATION=+